MSRSVTSRRDKKWGYTNWLYFRNISDNGNQKSDNLSLVKISQNYDETSYISENISQKSGSLIKIRWLDKKWGVLKLLTAPLSIVTPLVQATLLDPPKGLSYLWLWPA